MESEERSEKLSLAPEGAGEGELISQSTWSAGLANRVAHGPPERVQYRQYRNVYRNSRISLTLKYPLPMLPYQPFFLCLILKRLPTAWKATQRRSVCAIDSGFSCCSSWVRVCC